MKAGHLCLDTCCLKCGRSADQVHQLELHHIVPIASLEPESTFNPNVQSNLATLCTDCHKSYHACYEQDYPADQFLSWVASVPLEEAWDKLKAYRAEKQQRRATEARKHRSRRASN